MANQSIKAAFARFWHHVMVKLNDYATVESLDAHIGNTSNPHNIELSQFGVTATSDELNHIDGVTSNVQEQLDVLSGLIGDTSVQDQIAAAGAGLPTVTTDNNGAFLRVVDGKWEAVTVPNAEEASF
jgi:hypothetical protein